MDYRKFDQAYYIRLDRGDEILSSLTDLCRREGIAAASVKGIGGCGHAAVGVFDPDGKVYRRQEADGMLELISLDGNVTVYEEQPYLHLHATFAYHGADGAAKVLAGHLLEATVLLTGEIVLTPADGRIRRRCDDALGIRVWDFD